MTGTTLVDLLDRAAASSHEVCFLDRLEQTTAVPWTELAAKAYAAAARLRAAGVAPGDRVALVYPTGRAFFEAFFATLVAGAVPVPLYPPHRLGRREEFHLQAAGQLRRCGARLVLADPRSRAATAPAVHAAHVPLGCCGLEDLPGVDGRGEVLDRPQPNDLGLVQFSSGSTSAPRAVALSHRALVAQARMLNASWPELPDGEHRGVSWLPLYHDMGLVGCVLTALERPGTLTLLAPEVFVARPALWLRAIARDRATISPAPDFAYAMAVSRIRDEDLEGCDLSSWQLALDGAEPIDPATLEAFSTRFARWGLRPEAVTPVYGLSEAALAVTMSPPGRVALVRSFDREALACGRAVVAIDGRPLPSLGTAIAGCELAIRDPHGVVLGPNQVGTVWVRSESLMDGYVGEPAQTDRVLVEGWLDTGDRGFLDDGELYLVGRSKDILIVNGRKFAPEDVEQAAAGITTLRERCVVAVTTKVEGTATESLLVFAEHKAGLSAAAVAELPNTIRRAVVETTGLRASTVVVLEPGALPRTSSGKLRRGATLERWLAGTLAAAVANQSWSQAPVTRETTMERP